MARMLLPVFLRLNQTIFLLLALHISKTIAFVCLFVFCLFVCLFVARLLVLN